MHIVAAVDRLGERQSGDRHVGRPLQVYQAIQNRRHGVMVQIDPVGRPEIELALLGVHAPLARSIQFFQQILHEEAIGYAVAKVGAEELGLFGARGRTHGGRAKLRTGRAIVIVRFFSSSEAMGAMIV